AVNQSAGVNRHQATAVEQTSKLQQADQLTPAAPLVNSSTHRISSLNLFSSSRMAPASKTVDATKTARSISSPADAGSPTVALQFEEFWVVFPPGRKKDKGGALVVFAKIITGKHTHRASAATLIDAAKRYAATKPNPEYTPMPTTWLN